VPQFKDRDKPIWSWRERGWIVGIAVTGILIRTQLLPYLPGWAGSFVKPVCGAAAVPVLLMIFVNRLHND